MGGWPGNTLPGHKRGQERLFPESQVPGSASTRAGSVGSTGIYVDRNEAVLAHTRAHVCARWGWGSQEACLASWCGLRFTVSDT